VKFEYERPTTHINKEDRRCNDCKLTIQSISDTVYVSVVSVELQDTEAKEDPLLVLKLRFVKGEISEQEYERIYSILKRDS
jgi:hypothetical protein